MTGFISKWFFTNMYWILWNRNKIQYNTTQSQTYQPIFATLLLIIQAHKNDLFVKTIAHTSPELINAIYITSYGKGFPTYRGLTTDNENLVLSFCF